MAFLARLLPLLKRRPSAAALMLAALVLLAEAVHLFYASTGTFERFETHTRLYDLLAEGFRAGHLYLNVKPAPQLLAAANPFDPANMGYWIWDTSYHRGHFYIYFGPLPALLLAAIKVLFRIPATTAIGDQFVVIPFFAMTLVCGALLVTRMARRLFVGVPSYLIALAVAVFAFANPTPFMLLRPGVYEAAICSGQAFVLLGLLFALDGVERAAADPRCPVLVAACLLISGRPLRPSSANSSPSSTNTWPLQSRPRTPRAAAA